MNDDNRKENMTEDERAIAELFSRAAQNAIPAEGLLRRTIERLPSDPVTSPYDSRYTDHRRSFINSFSDMFSMQNNWKMGIPVVAVVLLVGIAVVGMKKGNVPPSGDTAVAPVTMPVSQESAPAPMQMKMAAASGSVDDILVALNTEASADQAAMADSDGDLALVASDDQVISDYGNSYDESSL